MNDLISRQAVLDAIKKTHWFTVQADSSANYPCVTIDDIVSLNVHMDIDAVRRAINDVPAVSGWVSVKDRLPVETHSTFYPFYGTQKWSNNMWREQSDKVLVTVAFKDGTKIVTTGETHDGIWSTAISRTLEPVVTHWMPLPEPPNDND